VKRDVISKSGKKLGDAVSAEHPIVRKKIDESLKLSIKEGSLASVSSGLGLSYLSPFALALNATSSQVGILHAVISLLPSLIQLKAAALINKFSRKKIVMTSILITTLLWVPIILMGVLFYFGVPHIVWILIGFIGLFYIFSAVAHPAWFSWMGSLVPEDQRGGYFSKRNRVAGFFGIITMIAGALILDGFKKAGGFSGNTLGYTLFGFGILFTLAAIVRFWSWGVLRKQYEPKLTVRKKDGFSFWQFLKRAPETPFGRFVLFRGFFSLAIGIAVPFWAVYMLRDLGFSYIWYVAITVSGIIFQLMFLPVLGKFSDRFGNIKLTSVCSWLIFLIPILWLIPAIIKVDLSIKLYLLFVPAIISGFGWAGYNLAVNNYVYDAVGQEKRGFGVSYMNLIVGLGTFVGAGLGSLLAWINVSFMNPLLFIFVVSAFARFLAVAFGSSLLREVRHVKKFSSQYLINEFEPMRGAIREIHHLEDIVKKVEHYK